MRAAAASIAALAAASLALQLAAAASELGLARGLWLLLGFFTILTNAMVCAVMARTALAGRAAPSAIGFAAVQIAVVGLVYHVVLARMYNPTGLAWWADLGLHTLVPLATLLFWWRFGRGALRPRHALLWLAWPLGFCLYAMVRGALTGWYPYFFLDPGVVGEAGVALWVAALTALFYGLGRLVIRLRAAG
jgi:hypothetical protein